MPTCNVFPPLYEVAPKKLGVPDPQDPPPPPGSAPEVNKISSVKNEIVQLESRFLLVMQQGNSVGEANFFENNTN